MSSAKKSGAKGQKIGRNGRAPSNAQQRQRTERNKDRKIKKAAAKRAADKNKVMKVPRGTARAKAMPLRVAKRQSLEAAQATT